MIKKPTMRSRRRAKCVHWLVVPETKTCVQVEWTRKGEENVYFAANAEEALPSC